MEPLMIKKQKATNMLWLSVLIENEG